MFVRMHHAIADATVAVATLGTAGYRPRRAHRITIALDAGPAAGSTRSVRRQSPALRRRDRPHILGAGAAGCHRAARAGRLAGHAGDRCPKAMDQTSTAGDGNDESFAAQMIVSADDIAPDIAGFRTSGFKAWGGGH
jgi:hypothetical protein